MSRSISERVCRAPHQYVTSINATFVTEMWVDNSCVLEDQIKFKCILFPYLHPCRKPCEARMVVKFDWPEIWVDSLCVLEDQKKFKWVLSLYLHPCNKPCEALMVVKFDWPEIWVDISCVLGDQKTFKCLLFFLYLHL